MKKTTLFSAAVILMCSTHVFANNITIERRIAAQADDIDNALAEGLITQEESTELRNNLSEIQAQDMANTSRSEMINKELMRDLDENQREIKSAIAYGS